MASGRTKPPVFQNVVQAALELGNDIDADDWPNASARLEMLWVLDMINVLQHLRARGSTGHPGGQAFDALVAHGGSLPPRSHIVTKAVADASSITSADLAILPNEAQRNEVRAFLGMKQWDDPVRGLPRAGSGATLTEQQAQVVDLIRHSRENIATFPGLHFTAPDAHKNIAGGYQYGGTPGKDPSPQNMGNPDPRRAQTNQWVWDELHFEGGNSAINTWDRPKLLTWGRGLASSGALPTAFDRLMAAQPWAHERLFDLGFTKHPSGSWLAVDTSAGVVKESAEAIELIRFEKKVLSVLVEIGSDAERGTSQTWSDIQFDQMRTGPAAVPEPVLADPGAWTRERIKLVAHLIWFSGAIQWPAYVGTGADLTAILRVVLPNTPRIKGWNRGGATCVDRVSTSGIVETWGEGVVRRTLLTTATSLPPDIDQGTNYAGHVFFDAGGGAFYHLPPP